MGVCCRGPLGGQLCAWSGRLWGARSLHSCTVHSPAAGLALADYSAAREKSELLDDEKRSNALSTQRSAQENILGLYHGSITTAMSRRGEE